jgi:succinate dehydrogenase flavin-adding protein (antitoxin of CptAB toxin-antitoxin module)
LSEADLEMFNSILDIEDQPIYDFIFKNISLGNQLQEDFILQRIKKFID